MVKKVSLLCVVIFLAASLVGCCDEEKCRQEFGLSKCTPEDCVQKHNCKMPGTGPPGPDIDLGPGSGNVLEWEIDGVVAVAGNSVFDPANHCKLRKDFIGKEVDDFKFKPENQPTKQHAGEIHLVSGDIYLKISLSSSGSMNWWIINKATEESCTLVYGDIPATANEVPAEFIGLTYAQPGDEFKEIYTKKNAEEMKIKVTY